ncbi:MAG: lipocalin family protein [Sulfitobacter sp.]
MRAWIFAVLALGMAACSAPASKPGNGYRDTSALIGATSRFALGRFAGAWTVREYFPTEQRLNNFDVILESGGTFTWVETTGQASLGQDAEQNATLGTITGQGRFRLDWDDKDYWILWVDEGFRTAVIGTPNGQFGYIVDRSRTGGADRIKAAREILDFNGYDVSKLRVVK